MSNSDNLKRQGIFVLSLFICVQWKGGTNKKVSPQKGVWTYHNDKIVL